MNPFVYLSTSCTTRKVPTQTSSTLDNSNHRMHNGSVNSDIPSCNHEDHHAHLIWKCPDFTLSNKWHKALSFINPSTRSRVVPIQYQISWDSGLIKRKFRTSTAVRSATLSVYKILPSLPECQLTSYDNPTGKNYTVRFISTESKGHLMKTCMMFTLSK